MEAEMQALQPTLADLRANIGDDAFVNWCLTTAYNENGIDRWWKRPRVQLDGLAPETAWNVPRYREKVIELAEWLVAPSLM